MHRVIRVLQACPTPQSCPLIQIGSSTLWARAWVKGHAAWPSPSLQKQDGQCLLPKSIGIKPSGANAIDPCPPCTPLGQHASPPVHLIFRGSPPGLTVMDLPPVITTGRRRVVGFNTSDSPSSVLRPATPGSATDGSRQRAEGESPLSALKRELSSPTLNAAAVPALPRLKLGGSSRARMTRSKSHGNLQASQPAAVPGAPKQRSAASSPHAASSGGSEPVRIPFE